MADYGSDRVRPPEYGEPAPRFTAATDGIDRYSIEVAAGRWMLLLAFGSASTPQCKAALEAVLTRRSLFNDTDAAFFGLSIDPADRSLHGLANAAVGVRYFWDFDRRVSEGLGLIGPDHFFPWVVLVDRSFRVAFSGPIEQTPTALQALERELAAEPDLSLAHAPVLELPRVFEPDLCARLIEAFRKGAPTASGFASDVEGRTVTLLDPRLKRRQDVTLEDRPVLEAVETRLRRRLLPAVETAFAWRPEDIERYLICRYGADEQGFFSAHRDNVTAGTAHRRFAVTINLNAEAYEGGDLRFPEYGSRLYRPPTGGAVVFSCSLLHEATAVTAGERFAFVPFLHQGLADAAALPPRRQAV